MLRRPKYKLIIKFYHILFLTFFVFFFDILAISANTTLILDFINLGILSFILFFLFLNSNLNYMFTAVPINYNAMRMLWTVKIISRVTHGNFL